MTGVLCTVYGAQVYFYLELKIGAWLFFSAYFHLFTYEKAAWPISEPTYFANYSATKI